MLTLLYAFLDFLVGIELSHYVNQVLDLSTRTIVFGSNLIQINT